MFDTLFGAEMPLAVRFFLAFLIVLGLIGVTAWAVRRFGSGRLGSGSARGRQPRLAVIDYASVDGRRRLILVRRDNVEHLLMIGGPTDVVVEPNIVRAVAAPRDLAGRPAAGLEALPRAIPLPETGNGGTWPLQPEPAAPPLRPAPRLEPLPDELPRALQPPAESPPRPPRDTLAALADELSARPAPPPPPSRSRPARTPPPPPPPPPPLADEPAPEQHGEARLELRPEPRVEPQRKPAVPPTAGIPAAPTPAPSIAPAPAAEPAADQSLADMAQRLEAALRKPGSAEARTHGTYTPPPRPAPAAEQPPVEPPAPPPSPTPPPRMPRPAEAKPARGDAKPGQGKTLYDNLEQEMASLLGRPTKP
jgi:flagellar protein FliO/FliZ